MRLSGSSYFTYPLTKPYPFAWFTWIAVIGGVIATILLSILNFAATGYVSKTVYTNNPNGTLHEYKWFNSGAWAWAAKISPTCEPALLTAGNQYFTSNLGLTYTLKQISQVDSNGTLTIMPAVSYLNANLTDCVIGSIDMQMGRKDSAPISDTWITWADSAASATVRCTVPTESSNVYLNLTVQLPKIIDSATDNLFKAFVKVDRSSPGNRTSLWWAAQLMNIWYVPISDKMSSQIPGGNDSLAEIAAGTYTGPKFDTGAIGVQRNFNVSDITSSDFFRVDFNFPKSDGNLDFSGTWDYVPLGQHWLDTDNPPQLASNWDIFAKAFYSTVLSDLGQPNEYNGAARPETLNYLLSALKDVPNNQSGGQDIYIGAYKLPDTYEGLKSSMEPLAVQNATIFAQYACSVPKQKDALSLIISVAVADLVFLQALWTLLNFAATTWLGRKNKDMNMCEGCLARGPGITRSTTAGGYEMLVGSGSGVGGPGDTKAKRSPAPSVADPDDGHVGLLQPGAVAKVSGFQRENGSMSSVATSLGQGSEKT